MNRRRNNIVGALPHVDMVIGMHLASAVDHWRQVRDYFVGIHIAACTGTRLEYVHRKMRIEFTVGDAVEQQSQIASAVF